MLNRRDFLVATGTAATALLLPSWARPGEARWQLPEKRPFRVVENEWIPMSDGTRLAARLWIPEGAEQQPVPVVFEYLPYRKRDDIRARDETTALNLAPYGLAFAREQLSTIARDLI